MAEKFESARQVGHVWLDMISGADTTAQTMDADAANLAFERMSEVGAIEATFDDETDVLSIEASPLAGGTLILLEHLVGRLAAETGRSKDAVIVAAREAVDEAAAAG